jgi:hypothetical protein
MGREMDRKESYGKGREGGERKGKVIVNALYFFFF